MKGIVKMSLFAILVYTLPSERASPQSQAMIGQEGVFYTTGYENSLPWGKAAKFTVLDENGAEAGYWFGAENSNVGELTQSLPESWSIRAIQNPAFYQFVTTEEGTGNAWQLSDENRPVAYWIPRNSVADNMFLARTRNLTAKKIEKETLFDDLKKKIYGETQESIEAVRASIRTTMVNEAKEIACKQTPRSSQFSATASFGASVTFVVGVEGSLDFSATWDTNILCASSN